MWKKWMAVLFLMLAAAGTAAAEDNAAARISSDGWTATEKDGVIIVKDEKDKEFARMNHQADEGVRSVLIADDYNFDGKDDIAALTSMGTANAYYAVWLRNAEGGFTEYPAFREICAPRCETLMQRIESFERVSAAEYTEQDYRWIDNELKAVWKRSVRYLDENGVNVQVTESVPGDEERIIHDREMPASLWNEAMQLMDAAELYSFLLNPESAEEVLIIYEGTQQVDGELYHAYCMGLDEKATGVIYLSSKNPQMALLDDTLDDDVNPKWQISLDGERIERNS